MAKRFKVVEPNEHGTSGTQCHTTDWNKCVLCQEDTDEMLKFPSNSRGTDGAGCNTIAENIVAFDKISSQLLRWVCACSFLALHVSGFRLRRADGDPCGLFGMDACGPSEMCVPPLLCPGAVPCQWKCFQDTCTVGGTPAFHWADTLWCDCPAGTFGSKCELTDEPATCATPCSAAHQSCYETLPVPVIFTCDCDPGYEVSGSGCVDTNECSASPAVCHIFASCTNNDGGYECDCLDGYIGNGHICVDNVCDTCNILEYEECDQEHNQCVCMSGFTRDDVCDPCVDIDECLDDPCPLGADCVNYAGVFVCFCRPGWDPSAGGCEDINECELDLDYCDYHAYCLDMGGMVWYCDCEDGYTGDGLVCYDIEECGVSDLCDENANCTDAFGQYVCECSPGWTGDGFQCEDAIECGIYDNCDTHAECIDCHGSYYCVCLNGWHGSGIAGDCHKHGSSSHGHSSHSHGQSSHGYGHSESHDHGSGSDYHGSGSHGNGSHGHSSHGHGSPSSHSHSHIFSHSRSHSRK